MPGFEPKTPVNLDPPKDDNISLEYLAKCDGMCTLHSGVKMMLTIISQGYTKATLPTSRSK